MGILKNNMRETQSMTKEHWQRVFSNSAEDKLGWYEAIPAKSLELIKVCSPGFKETILDVGSGSSTLIDHLLSEGFSNIVAVDISQRALEKSQKRLGNIAGGKVRWLVDDLTDSKQIINLSEVCLWHDRAVLHFLTETWQQDAYRTLLDKVLKKGGYAIIATFSLQGAEKCSGLKVVKYDQHTLSAFLGRQYKLIRYFDYIYFQPSGNPRPFVYSLFRKK